MNSTNSNEEVAFELKKEFIYNAIDDNENTIRFLDTKVGGVYVVIGLIIAFLGGINESIYNTLVYFKSDLIDFIIIITSILGYAILTTISVIYGFFTIKSINNPLKHIDSTDVNCEESLWHLSVNKNGNIAQSLKDYIRKINELNYQDLLQQISCELMKISYIRNEKLNKSNLCIKYFISSLIPLCIILIYIFVYYCFIK